MSSIVDDFTFAANGYRYTAGGGTPAQGRITDSGASINIARYDHHGNDLNAGSAITALPLSGTDIIWATIFQGLIGGQLKGRRIDGSHASPITITSHGSGLSEWYEIMGVSGSDSPNPCVAGREVLSMHLMMQDTPDVDPPPDPVPPPRAVAGRVYFRHSVRLGEGA